MKKTLCYFLIAILLMISGTVYAQTEKEITFRGFDWGESYKEVRTALEAGEPSYWLSMRLKSCQTQYFIEHASETVDYINQYEFWTTICLYTKLDVNVAGYQAEKTYLMFAKKAPEEGENDENEDAVLYRAMYYIPGGNVNSDELEAKLVSLYGEPDSVFENNIWSQNYTTKVWKGANNTFCALRVSERGHVYLIYGTFDGDQWLEEVNEAYAKKALLEEEERERNVDGL